MMTHQLQSLWLQEEVYFPLLRVNVCQMPYAHLLACMLPGSPTRILF